MRTWPKYKVCSVEEMRAIDEEAPNYGVDHSLLMEDAGTAVYDVVSRELGVKGKRFVVIAGTGNNGGDALVAARRIYSRGGMVNVFLVGDPDRLREPAGRNYEIARRMGIPITLVREEGDLGQLAEELSECDAALVGLIGIGLKGEVTGLARSVIELVNSSGKPVISVDIPSGINANNGKVCGVAVKSTYTITFGLPKYGNILYPGYYYCGKLYVSRLSYRPEDLDSDRISAELNAPVELPERVRWGHKGTFGKFLAVAGSRYYYGAPYYVAYSFLKAGGGYSRLAAPKSVVPFIAARCNEIVFHPMEETEGGALSLRNLEKVPEIIEEHGVDIVALGPGISLDKEAQELVRSLARTLNRPLIIDGDGLTAISSDLEAVKSRQAVLTPHPGEFARLTGLSTKDISEDPIGAVRKFARELSVYVVLKGAHSLIGYPDGRVYINMTGNPGMAKAGSGDVLTGTIAAMYGIGLRDLGLATRMGVLAHGLAGDLAAEDLGEDGVVPDNILEKLPLAVKLLRERPDYIIEKYMPKYI